MRNLEKILRYVILGGVFLVPFIPFLVGDSMFFPFITLKNFTFRIIVEIMLGSWAILAVLNSYYRPQWSPILIAIASFVGIIAIADIFGESFYKSFWSNYERMEGLVTLLHLLAYFVVAISVLTKEKLWTWFFQVSLFASVMMGIYSLFQIYGDLTINQGGVRVDGRLGNATYLAVYMLFHVFLAAFLIVRHKNPIWLTWLYGGVIVFDTFILYHTATRGAVLGLIGGALLALLLIALFEKGHKTLRYSVLGGIVGILVLVGAFVAVKDSNFVTSNEILGRFASISLDSGDTRFKVWNIAYQGFKERPLLGWGQENFNYIFNKYYDPSLYADEPFFDRAHNVFFDWLTQGGLLGLLAYLSIFISTLYLLWRKTGNHFSIAGRSVMTGLLAAYFFHNLFVFDNIVSYILFFSVIAYIHTVAVGPKDTKKDVKVSASSTDEERNLKQMHQYSAIAIFVILTAFTVYALNVKPILANRMLIQAFQPPQDGNIENNLDYFKQALAYDTFGSREIREQLWQTTGNIIRNETVSNEIKQKFANLSDQEVKKQLEQFPNDTRYQIMAGSLYGNLGALEQAETHLKRAIELSPGKQQTYTVLASLYLNHGRNKDARELMETAYELEPKNKEVLDVYALSLIFSGERDKAEELLISEYGTPYPPKNNFAIAYRNAGDFVSAVRVYENVLANLRERGGDSFSTHVSLAALYFEIGQKQKAISALERAIEINPEFKDQGEFYIEEIKAGRRP